MKRKQLFIIVIALIVSLCGAVPAWAQSRNASFVNPNSVSTKSGDGKIGPVANTVVADPAAIDAGETLVNVARRVTVFFYNGFRVPVQMNDLTLNADGNVRSKVVTDDCKAIKTLPVGDKCSVALEITPSSPGPWSVELLLNHSGIGRITRAEVNGTTLGKADEKAEGLAISKKIAAPLDFGSVMVNEEKAARTMLIENDSTTPLLISSIDLIASEGEGLSIRSTGCKEGNELKPGESCPITVLWEPKYRGNVATDLIVRHSGNLGFVVVPIRGAGSSPTDSKEAESDSKSLKPRSANAASLMPRNSGDASQLRASSPSLEALPLPSRPTNDDGVSGQEIARNMAPLKSAAMNGAGKKNLITNNQSDTVETQQPSSGMPQILLIGTVGDRAILGDADDQTYMVGLGEKTQIGGSDVELLQLDPTRVVVMVAGQRMNLSLRNKQTVAYKKVEKEGSSDSKSSADEKSRESEKQAPTPKIETPAAAKQINNSGSSSIGLSQSSGLSPAGLSAAGLNAGTIGGSQVNSGATAQDVLNMLK